MGVHRKAFLTHTLEGSLWSGEFGFSICSAGQDMQLGVVSSFLLIQAVVFMLLSFSSMHSTVHHLHSVGSEQHPCRRFKQEFCTWRLELTPQHASHKASAHSSSSKQHHGHSHTPYYMSMSSSDKLITVKSGMCIQLLT